MLFKNNGKFNNLRSILVALIASTLLLPGVYNSISIILLLVSWLVLTPTSEMKESFHRNIKYVLPFLILFLLFGASLLYSEDTKSGLKDLESKLSLLIFPFVVLCQRPFSKTEVEKSLKIFSILIALCCVFILSKSYYQFNRILSNQELSALVGLHASYLSLYISFCFFFVLQQFIKGNKSKYLFLIATIFAITLVFLSARMVILTTCFITLIWFVIIQFSWKRILVAFISITFLGAVAFNIDGVRNRFEEAIYFEEVELTDEVPEDEVKMHGGGAIRVGIWESAINIVTEHWMIGVGAGDVHQHLQQSYKDRKFLLAWKYNNYNSHNLFIETIIAVGLLGIVCLFFLFWFLFKTALQKRDLLFFAFASLFFCFSQMEASFNVQRGIVFFVLFSCLFLNLKQNSTDLI